MREVDVQYVAEWLDTLDSETTLQVFAAIELTQERGPSLKRSIVGNVVVSRYSAMKELRPGSSGKSEI